MAALFDFLKNEFVPADYARRTSDILRVSELEILHWLFRIYEKTKNRQISTRIEKICNIGDFEKYKNKLD